MFKNIRILILLSILLIVAVNSFYDKNQDWKQPIYIGLYPINADGSAVVDQYIATLTQEDFKQIDDYIAKQSANFNRPAYMYYRLGEKVDIKPPEVPRNGGIMDAIVWSLKFRYYAYKHRPESNVKPSLTLFLQYHSPDKKIIMDTSTALQNGRIGVVNLFATKDKAQTNNVVIAHESLHGFGATDKYDLSNGMPIYPYGYANPTQNPTYPQAQAELMAMHKATSSTQFEMARSLNETVIGEMTATEIGWIELK